MFFGGYMKNKSINIIKFACLSLVTAFIVSSATIDTVQADTRNGGEARFDFIRGNVNGGNAGNLDIDPSILVPEIITSYKCHVFCKKEQNTSWCVIGTDPVTGKPGKNDSCWTSDIPKGCKSDTEKAAKYLACNWKEQCPNGLTYTTCSGNDVSTPVKCDSSCGDKKLEPVAQQTIIQQVD